VQVLEQPDRLIVLLRALRLDESLDLRHSIIGLLEWDDLDLARRFSRSENLRAVMQEAGVAERPDIYILDGVETIPA